ncbi:divergent polysaccharide deacetylase family protein [Borreliella burgdorferi]|uniref:divergent polysaccharide deacetylase family protein n=1 Tax=Borreliella burgdorferi TaxID=139 RepID=UPI00017F4A79|nr:divergent polysaccharide deacetylase family protein [Borreliella burgdorferi]EEF83832.1 divergent polysaccharide deacetylase family protein [Borreliella burgdorferi CA-11.2A]MCD2385944.1 divergent polysaccharide deacetylase family protein [Borreliella burgdorferi]MCD2387252.1 divergent polysaccharide deacetylase family protein [Borreliella burgdorferi]MCD2390985.1 divergent polysaccharide deacetylase family protein [Borreliella burgdorferi]MCD2416664.1 divergent polysaccharide deacetylase f
MFVFYIKKNKFIIVIFIIISIVIAITQTFASFLYFNDNSKIANAPLKNRFEKTQKESLIIKNNNEDKKAKSKPKFYLIIDDVGYDEFMLEQFIKLNLKITYAIIPFLPKSMSLYKKLKNANKTVIIHFPMQSKHRNSIEKFHINIKDKKEEIHKKIEKAFKKYPDAKIMNNHMGSLITSNKDLMKIILEKLKEIDRYFFDSVTIAGSVPEIIGKEIGVKVEKRDVFLDSKDTEESVTKELEKAKNIARKNGMVKVIGHIWSKNTLKVLKKEGPNLNQEFEFDNLLNLYEETIR